MAYGLTIYNNSNEIQVDGTYKNFSLHDSGSWSVTGAEHLFYNFAPTTSPPIVGVRPLGTYCIAAQYKRNTSGEYYSTQVYAESSITLPYIVFNEAAIGEIPSGAYGLAVYNEYGNLVFHNHNKWCQLISNNIFANPLKSDCSGAERSSVDITVEDADNNYFILRPFCEHKTYRTDLDQTHVYQNLMKRVDQTTIRVMKIRTYIMGYNEPFYCYSSEYLNLIEVGV